MKVHALPADYGDSLLIEYGSPAKWVLIDGGTDRNYATLKARLLAIMNGPRTIELLVVTHVDEDHILGVLEMLRDPDLQLDRNVKRIWFNAWHHLAPENGRKLGPDDGDELAMLLDNRYAKVWNLPFDPGGLHNGAVVTNEDGSPRGVSFAGLDITILSPTPQRLLAYVKKWAEDTGRIYKKKQGPKKRKPERSLGTTKFDRWLKARSGRDSSRANGSSIAILLEADGKRLLLTGDAFKSVMKRSITALAQEGQRLAVDLFKLSHHGSRNNSSPELLGTVDAEHWLICTNGEYYEHPNPESVAWAVVHGRADERRKAKIHFNYDTDQTKPFRSAVWRAKFNYEPFYPSDNESGITIEL